MTFPGATTVSQLHRALLWFWSGSHLRGLRCHTTASRRASQVLWQVGMPGTAAKAVPPWGGALGFQKSSTCSLCCPGDPVLEEPGRPLTQPVTLSRAVCDRLSLVHHITSPKAVSAPWRRLQLLPSCFPWSFSLHLCLNLRCRSCLLSLAAAPGTVW